MLTPQPKPADPELVRYAMRQWSTGVTVVSTRYGDLLHGMTVNSFTSISLEPPLLLVSLNMDARTHELIQKSGIFGVTILEQSQQEISDRFAGRIGDENDRFAGLETFSLGTGAPFLVGGLAFLDCQVVQSYPAGHNTLFIGQVEAVKEGPPGMPLVYHNRAYWRLG